MKYEWRKNDKELYLPKTKPTLIEIPRMPFFVIDGKGNPNTSSSFEQAIGALYSLSYSIKMLPKGGVMPDGYFEYNVFPLEGVWDIDNKDIEYTSLTKDNLVYSLMIRQPDFVTKSLALDTIEKVKIKKPNKELDNVHFEAIDDGLCVEMMHIGSYDDEQKSFDIMEKFCEENNLVRLSKTHREIYISDPRKTSPDKMKTVLRFRVERKL